MRTGYTESVLRPLHNRVTLESLTNSTRLTGLLKRKCRAWTEFTRSADRYHQSCKDYRIEPIVHLRRHPVSRSSSARDPMLRGSQKTEGARNGAWDDGSHRDLINGQLKRALHVTPLPISGAKLAYLGQWQSDTSTQHVTPLVGGTNILERK